MSAISDRPPFIFPVDFSGTLVIRKGREVVFQAARGYANRSDYMPNGIGTRYSLASVSKAFTAVAILQLAEEGRFLLEEEVFTLLPHQSFLHFTPGVTVHRLLTHSSGIPDYFDEAVQDDYAALWQERAASRMRRPADFLPMFRDRPMQFVPGTAFRYNNAGYILLALLVEEMTGKPFAEAMAERVFRKGGMAGSGYFALDRMPSCCATGYREDEIGWRSNIFDIPPVGGGDGGAWSHAQDLLRFWDAVCDGTLLGQTMKSLMHKRHQTARNGDGYGYGVWLKDMGDHDAWFLEGCDPGASAFSFLDPVREVSFVILSNTDYGVWDLSAEIIRLVRRGEI